MRWSRLSNLRASISAVALLFVLAQAGMAQADEVGLRAGERAGGVRLVFDWPKSVAHSARLSGQQLIVHFDRPAEADISGLTGLLPKWIARVQCSDAGRTLLIDLRQRAKVSSFVRNNLIVVDLMPAASAAAPIAPKPVAEKPAAVPAVPREAALRISHHDGYDRAVIQLAGRASAQKSGNVWQLTAPLGRQLTSAQLEELKSLPAVNDVAQSQTPSRQIVRITLKEGATLSPFRSASGVGLDFRSSPSPVAAAQKPSQEGALPPPASEGTAHQAAAKVADDAPAPQAAPEVKPVDIGHLATGPSSALPADVARTASASAPEAPLAHAPEPQAQAQAAAPSPEATATPVQAVTQADMPVLQMTSGPATPIAVYRRAGALYVVVNDKNMPRELIPLVGSELASGHGVQLLPAQGGRAIRIPLPDDKIQPIVQATGQGWSITFVTSPVETVALDVLEQPDYATGARVLVAVANPASPVMFVDPVVGDTLMVVPAAVQGAGVTQRHHVLQADVLPSYQGVVIRPWADDVSVISSDKGVEVTAAGGLRLAEKLASEQPLVPAATPDAASASGDPSLVPLFDFPAMKAANAESFTDGRIKMQQAIMAASDHDKAKAWLDLARYYFFNGMSTEAGAIWRDRAKADPALANTPEYTLVQAVAAFSSGTSENIRAAISAINQPTADGALWRGMLAVRDQDWTAAHESFSPVLERIWAYPEPYLSRLAVAAIETAIQTQDYELAQTLLTRLSGLYRAEQREPTPAMEYLTGALDWGRERYNEARGHFGSAAQSWSQLWRVRAELSLIDADMREGKVSPVDILKRLERLRFAWRGDALEFDILHRLARQHLAVGEYAAAFDDFAQMTSKFPDQATKLGVAEEQKAAFIRIFQGDDRDRTPAFSQLAVWDRYPDFRPTEPSVLQNARLYLADRVAGIDLIDRAADFYKEVIGATADPVEKASYGTKLAGLYLLDGRHDEAIAILNTTEPSQGADQPSVLPDEARDERRILMARAIFGQGKPDAALELLASDYSEPATRLRADIAWKTRRWPVVVATLDSLIGTPAADKPLSAQVSALILKQATALALSGDRAGLDALRDKYSKPMEQTADASTFQMLTRPELAGGVNDRSAITGSVAQVDLFQQFLERYRGTVGSPIPAGSALAKADAAAAASPHEAPAQPH